MIPMSNQTGFSCAAQAHVHLDAILTHTAKSFFAQADQHIEAHVAVSRLREVFQPPHVVAVLFQRVIDTCGWEICDL